MPNNNPKSDLQEYKRVKKELIELRALGSAITEEQRKQLEINEKLARVLGKKVKAQEQFAKTLKGNLSDFEEMDDTMVSIGNQIGKNTKLAEQTSKSFTKVKLVAASIVAELANGGATNEKTEKQVEAAVATLKCAELENETASWAARLRYAYADALEASGDHKNAQKWFVKSAEININQETDANERIKSN